MRVKDYNRLTRFGKFALIINILCVLLLALAYLATYINPTAVPQMAFFGLLYPFSLLANFLFLFYWLLKRRKYFLISLITIIIGFSHMSRFIQFTILQREDETKETEIKVMSYNVRLFDLYNWTQNKQTRNEIFKFLANEDPDVICFQEFYQQDQSNSWNFKTTDTLVQFLKAKNYAEGYTVNVSNNKFFGLVTMSKFPIVTSDHIKFENDRSNSFLYTDLLIQNDTIRVYNAHIGSARFSQADYEVMGTEGNYKTWPHQKSEDDPQIFARLTHAYKKRVAQTSSLLTHSYTSPYPVIICGDFNDTPVSFNYRSLTRNYFDAFTLSGTGTAGTYCAIPMLRIDYLLHSDFFNSYAYQTHDEELSDHRAISAILEY